jgi:hypothetical protein
MHFLIFVVSCGITCIEFIKPMNLSPKQRAMQNGILKTTINLLIPTLIRDENTNYPVELLKQKD